MMLERAGIANWSTGRLARQVEGVYVLHRRDVSPQIAR